ncbi:hypothetical protein FOF46_10365, partial [Aquimarina algiphila]
MKIKIPLIVLIFTIIQNYAQELSIDADIRPRLEYLNGFGSLLPDGVDAGLFVQQRSRLKFGY